MNHIDVKFSILILWMCDKHRMNSVHSVLKSMYSYTIYIIEKNWRVVDFFLTTFLTFFLCSFFDHQIMRGFYVHFVYLFFFIHCVVLYIIRIFITSWLIQSLWSLFFNFKQLTYVGGGGGLVRNVSCTDTCIFPMKRHPFL